MDIERIGKASPAHDVAVGDRFFPARARGPVGALGNGVDEVDRARILEVAQAVFDRIDAGFGRQFVDVGFMGESVRQRRDAAKPGGAHDRRHVVGHHAHGVIIIRRDRGAVAHLEHGRHRRDGSGQQQRQSGRAVGGIAGRKIVTGDAAVGAQAALDVHQLRGAFRLPGVLLFARQLHANRTADRARQQNRVGRDVVGAVAAVAAGGLHPDHVDLGIRPLQQQCEVGAQDVRILRARPHPNLILPDVRDRTGRTDRAVHLIRPDIRPLHRLFGGGDGSIDIALVDQDTRRRRIGAKRGLDVFQVGQRRGRLPGDFELGGGLDRVLLALGDDADEIADFDHGDQARNIAHRSFVDRDQAGADKGAGIDAGIGRPHHAAMQHAGHAYVVNINQFAGRLRRKIDAGHRLPDNGVGIDRLDGNVIGQFEADGLAGNQFAVADAAVVVSADQAVFHDKVLLG